MIDFLNNFSTEEQCLAALEEIRWDWKCPKCGCLEYWRHWKRRVRICSWCRSVLSVTADTVLHRLRIPLRALFLIWWFMVTSKQGVSAEELSELLWISTPTAWLWNQKFRKIMILEDRAKLKGHVEVDEVFVWGKQIWPRGRWAKWKKIIVIAVEVNMETRNKQWFFRGMWRVRIQVIPNCWEKTLSQFVKNNIDPWSIVYTDKWASYNNLDKIGYSHVLQSESIKNEDVIWVNAEEVTPNVHIIASLLKRWLLWTHQKYMVNDWYLQDYIEEYTFRFNRRKASNRWNLFKTLLEQILSHNPTTKNTIKKHLQNNTKQVVSG